jgi:hypothetical protein
MLTSSANAVDVSAEARRTRRFSGATRWQAKGLPIALLYLLLPNLPLLFSIYVLGVSPHGYINLEYLAIGAVSSFLPRGAIFLLLLMESVADFAYVLCYTFQFSPGSLLSSIRYVFVLPQERVLEGLALLLLIIVVCGFLAHFRLGTQLQHKATGILLLFIVFLLGIDIVGGRNPLWHRVDLTLIPIRVTRSPLVTLGLRELQAYRSKSESGVAANQPMFSASSAVIPFLDNRLRSAPAPNVVLIVVESWGLPLDTRIANALTAPYDDSRLAQKYNISHGTAPFTGLTVPGEARELCHSTIGFGIMRASPELVEQCLPALFHRRGYQSIAIHGYLGQMFFRSTWYRELGFDRRLFKPDLLESGLPICKGALPGICDASIAGWIGSTLESEPRDEPEFIYWVTLNSHLPEPAHPDLPDDSICAVEPTLRDSAALCSWFRLVRAVHQSVQQTALIPTSRPTVFVIVGDHAPPFGSPQLRADFSTSLVPYEMLTPMKGAAN